MRLLFLLLITSSCWGNLVSLASTFTDDSDQPIHCFGPCTRCRPGFYFGSQFGYAWIDSPTHNDSDDPLLALGHHCRGNFAWGAFGGYCMRTLQTIYVGIQGGYNDNGSSTLQFASHNRYKIQSCDWELLGTFTYVLCKCFTFCFKGGVARVHERFRPINIEENATRYPHSERREYHPTLTTGGGICLFNLLHVFLYYRGIYAYHQAPLTKAFNRDCKWKHVSSVNAVLAGFSLLF